MFKYTKRITLNHLNKQSLAAHIMHPAYDEWFARQADQNYVDVDRDWLPYCWSDEFTAEVLASDQNQADSLVNMITTLGNEIGHQLQITVSNFDETSENLIEFLDYIEVKHLEYVA